MENGTDEDLTTPTITSVEEDITELAKSYTMYKIGKSHKATQLPQANDTDVIST